MFEGDCMRGDTHSEVGCSESRIQAERHTTASGGRLTDGGHDRSSGKAVWMPCDGHVSRTTDEDGAEALLRRLVKQGGDLSWQLEARCAQTDPDAFFPDRGRSAQDAKKVCEDCAVREKCLDWAIEHNERFGIWGGLSQQERKKLRRTRRA